MRSSCCDGILFPAKVGMTEQSELCMHALVDVTQCRQALETFSAAERRLWDTVRICKAIDEAMFLLFVCY